MVRDRTGSRRQLASPGPRSRSQAVPLAQSALAHLGAISYDRVSSHPGEAMRTIVSLALLAGLLPAQNTAKKADPLIGRMKHEGLQNSRVMDYLDHLTNTIGHRLTGSDNFERACHWAKAEFEKMGLTAQLHKWKEWKVRFNRGQWSGRMLEPSNLELQVATEAWTAGTRGQVTGKAVKPPTDILDLEETWSGKVEGAWLLARKSGRRGGPFWGHLKRFARDEGAAGIIYPSTGDAKFPNRIRVFGNRRMALAANATIPTMPEICVRKDQFAAVEKLIAAGKKVVLRFDIRNRFRREKVPLYNVIADIRGTQKPDEYVMVGGHLVAPGNGHNRQRHRYDVNDGSGAHPLRGRREATAHDPLLPLGRRGAGPARIARLCAQAPAEHEERVRLLQPRHGHQLGLLDPSAHLHAR